MYYKNYGINGDLEKYYKMPLNTDISLEENQRIIGRICWRTRR